MTKQVMLSEFSEELAEYAESNIEQTKAGVARGLARSVPDLVRASPVDTGLYAQSWGFNVDEVRGIIGNYAPHAPIIEFGARPFTPPLKPLLEWAKRVLNDASQPPNYSKRVWALAVGTRNKIAKVGMAPRHILEKQIPAIIENIRQELKNA